MISLVEFVMVAGMATEGLKQFISSYTEVPPSEWLHFVTHLRLKKLKKGDRFFEQGIVTEEIGFVISGLIYTYYTDAQGETAIKNFAWERRLISPYASLLLNQPSFFSARCWEDTWVVVLKHSDLKKMYARHACWEKLGRKAAEKVLIERERREYESLLLDGQARYREFLKFYAAILDRIPQWMIASYIGITPVALSRLRKQNTGRAASNDENPAEVPFPQVEENTRPF